MDAQTFFDILKRDAVSIFTEEALLNKLKSGRKLRIKLGADPSRPDLHLGHSVVLRKLRMFQNLGHEIVFVIGDFTGMIGDPSGRSKTRVPLTFEQTRENGQSYFEQVTKILDKDKTVITYNSEWLAKLNFADVLALAGKYTVARIMERDDFAKRYAENQPIGLHETFYPLMQGYDSIALNADIEVGGTDQTFNLLVGRELQKDYGQEQQAVITFPLLIGLDGIEKMSKSLDNYIGIDEAPEIMFEKCMKIPDELMHDYFRLTTDADMKSISELIQSDIREAHFEYAREIVKTYHSADDVAFAEKRYKEVASGKVPEIMETFNISEKEIGILNLLKDVGFASSISDARRLISGRGIKINGETITDEQLIISSNMNINDHIIIRKGKNKFAGISFL
ncbi:MAG: tyrosine--tRNA ligase [Saccharofermentanales bacterium]